MAYFNSISPKRLQTLIHQTFDLKVWLTYLHSTIASDEKWFFANQDQSYALQTFLCYKAVSEVINGPT